MFIYPRMFSIHDMTTDTGLPSDNADEDCPTAGPNQVRLPSILNLSYERYANLTITLSVSIRIRIRISVWFCYNLSNLHPLFDEYAKWLLPQTYPFLVDKMRMFRLSSNGIFLLENGHDLFMWIGRAVNPAILNTLFGLNSLEGADMQNLRINPENSDFSSRLDAVITALRADRARYVFSFIEPHSYYWWLLVLDFLNSFFFLCFYFICIHSDICSCTSSAKVMATRRRTLLAISSRTGAYWTV
mgnify:CR=1 FL=1